MLPPSLRAQCPLTRKHLSFDPLVHQIRQRAEQIPDSRIGSGDYLLADAIMAGFAMFSLKDPSLLAFQDRRKDENMKRLFRVAEVASDTRMREVLDPLDPDSLRPMFPDVFRQLQRGKALEDFVFHDGYYLASVDATEYFCSKKISCSSCLQRTTKSSGAVTFFHQLLAAVVVHPNHKEVIPFAPEPIIRQDGDNKNDCERNAGKRLLPRIRAEHPHLKLIVIEDGLASNAPHIRLLQELDLRFLLVAHPEDHEHLFEAVTKAHDEPGRVTVVCWNDEREPEVKCEIRFVHDLPLNKSNPDVRVNFLHYVEYSPDGEIRRIMSWVTDLIITKEKARWLVRGARARWKIENETFNTLKNQGYHFEHNYGHGEQHLSVVFAMLTMLAFLVDQTQQICCPLFQAVHKKLGSKRVLWERVRSHFYHFVFRSMRQLYEVVLYDLAKELPLFPELLAPMRRAPLLTTPSLVLSEP
jgi:hypothetical protein